MHNSCRRVVERLLPDLRFGQHSTPKNWSMRGKRWPKLVKCDPNRSSWAKVAKQAKVDRMLVKVRPSMVDVGLILVRFGTHRATTWQTSTKIRRVGHNLGQSLQKCCHRDRRGQLSGMCDEQGFRNFRVMSVSLRFWASPRMPPSQNSGRKLPILRQN